MAEEKKYDIIVIGAGAAGLVVALGAAKAKRKVLLVEKGKWGGDCTNFGCVPSKSLIASSNAAETIRQREAYGLKGQLTHFDSQGALTRAREIVEKFRKQEEPKALKLEGVEGVTGQASFLDSHRLHIELDNGKIRKVYGKKIVIATGTHPIIPHIQGLDTVPYLTNETVFDLQIIPKHLAVIGGGPISCELSQAFHRLGAKVTIIQHKERLLMKEEPEVAELVANTFSREGIELLMSHETEKVSYQNKQIELTIRNIASGKRRKETCSHLLVAVGRHINVEGLDLENSGIKWTPKGIKVDRFGRTSKKHIYAIGDVTGRALFTHVAENEARTVLKNLLFPWPIRFKKDLKQPIPRVTFTDPEIACCGLSLQEAEKEYGKNKVVAYTVPFTENDRAITAGHTEGFAKIITKKWSSKILGATIVSQRAGEMLPQVSLAMQEEIPLKKLAKLIHPYPTYSLAIRKAADQWLLQTILPSFNLAKKK